MYSTMISKTRIIKTLSAAALLLTIIGCATIEQLAPPLPSADSSTSSAAVSLGSISDTTLQQARRGRQIYITECIKCHSPERVTRYSQIQWNEILPRMAEESKLPPEKITDIAAYIRLTLLLDESDAVRTAQFSDRP